MNASSAAVLVGGKSRRMGLDKALLDMGGQCLIQQVIEVLQGVASELLLVGTGAERYSWLGGRPVDDLYPEGGPLGGIYTALSGARHSHCIVVACDMPFLNAKLLRYMLQQIAGWDAVVPRLHGRLEPLHAVYARTCLAPIENMLNAGDLSVLELYPLAQVRYLEAHEVAPLDPGLVSFINLNTPADVALARILSASRDGNVGNRQRGVSLSRSALTDRPQVPIRIASEMAQ